jgi:hypothetical protein
MLATKCPQGFTNTRMMRREGREVLGKAREKEGYFPFRKMLGVRGQWAFVLVYFATVRP